MESSWSEILQINAVKKNMPDQIRKRRQAASRRLYNTTITTTTSSYPTRLHALCDDPQATLSALMTRLDRDDGDDPTSAVRVTDVRGRLPLHVLGDCESRLTTPAGKKIATAVALRLLQMHPEALVTADEQGFFPFVSLIAEWMEWTFATHHNKEKETRAAVGPKLTLPWKASTGGDDETMQSPNVMASSSLFARGTPAYDTRIRVFPTPEIWDEVEWCLTVLSTAMDELGGKNGRFDASSPVINDDDDKRGDFADSSSSGPRQQRAGKKPDRLRRDVASHLITVLPNLIKCVLLIPTEGGETRRRLLKLSIFRRLFLCEESVGEWLTCMLRKTGAPSRRAVDFLQYISETDVNDYTGGFRPTTVEDVRRFHDERDGVFNAVNELESTMGSLVVLQNKETERAATTNVIWHIMGERLGRPFVLGLVLTDLVLHIALMLAFRSTARTAESRIGGCRVLCFYIRLSKGSFHHRLTIGFSTLQLMSRPRLS